MGETGCGKTRLVKFMCDLWKPPGTENLRNMVLVKVLVLLPIYHTRNFTLFMSFIPPRRDLDILKCPFVCLRTLESFNVIFHIVCNLNNFPVSPIHQLQNTSRSVHSICKRLLCALILNAYIFLSIGHLRVLVSDAYNSVECVTTITLSDLCRTHRPSQVHGGTTERDVIRKVNQASQLAQTNRQEFPRVDTVLFFDEANTTEAIGLIKEIICDKRMKGRALPYPEGLKVIAACNPYRK